MGRQTQVPLSPHLGMSVWITRMPKSRRLHSLMNEHAMAATSNPQNTVGPPPPYNGLINVAEYPSHELVKEKPSARVENAENWRGSSPLWPWARSWISSAERSSSPEDLAAEWFSTSLTIFWSAILRLLMLAIVSVVLKREFRSPDVESFSTRSLGSLKRILELIAPMRPPGLRLITKRHLVRL
jgi:hypothetical protein